ADEIGSILDLVHLRYLLKHAPASLLAFVAEQEMKGAAFAEYWARPEIQLPLHHAAGIGSAEKMQPQRHLTVQRERRYALHPDFYAPAGLPSPGLETIIPLLDTLDKYRPLPNGGLQ